MIWENLESEAQLNAILESSEHTPVAIFKHSTRCNISSMVKDRMERKSEVLPENFKIFYLDLLNFRNISNRIADNLGVQHQSPQLLLIKNGQCVFHASHGAISTDVLSEQIMQSQS